MPKPRLIILSDLFGGENPEWIKYYLKVLEPKFDIQYYDVLELGEIDSINFNEMKIHNQFLNGGIEKAVENFLKNEKNPISILAFSIGGTIAWRASLQGLKTSQLIAVSSTRLRFETKAPDCKIKLYYGEKDLNIPNSKWFSDLGILNYIFENEQHQLYLNEKHALLICNDTTDILE